MGIQALIDNILRREGGFVNHPADRGGPTNYGITRETLARWRGKNVSVQDVAELSELEARDIYISEYLTRPRFDQIRNESLRALVVDCGVNHGTPRAALFLQEAVGVVLDGIVGPITLRRVNQADAAELYRKVLAQRCRFYGRLITDDHSQAIFAAGWAARLAEFIEEAP